MVCRSRHSLIVKRKRQQCFFRVSQQTFYFFWYIVRSVVHLHNHDHCTKPYAGIHTELLWTSCCRHTHVNTKWPFWKKDMYQGQLLYSNNGGRKDAFLCATPTITTTLWFYSISLIVMFRFRDIRLHVI